MHMRNTADIGRTVYRFGDKYVTACLDELSDFP